MIIYSFIIAFVAALVFYSKLLRAWVGLLLCRKRFRKTAVHVLRDGSKLVGILHDDGTAEFRNVPYAEVPSGSNRFKPPRKKRPWVGIRECFSSYGPFPMQMPYFNLPHKFTRKLVDEGFGLPRFLVLFLNFLLSLPSTPPDQSEDSLSLCVRVGNRKREDRRLLPVMVWICGGDMHEGSGVDFTYRSNVLASEGSSSVVVVYINYRLGVFGFFAHEDLANETPSEDEYPWGGDAGIRDQILALKWVRENIETFGGDANNVTVFGESAGGESVLMLMSSPASVGLFHKAIVQSPNNGGQFLARNKSMFGFASAEEEGAKFASYAVGDRPGQLNRLRALPAKELRDIYMSYRHDGYVGFYPVIGTQESPAVIPTYPTIAFETGTAMRIPLIIGYCSDEGSVLAPLLKEVIPAGTDMARRSSVIFPRPFSDDSSGAFCMEEGKFRWDKASAKNLAPLYPGLDGSLGENCRQEAQKVIYGDIHFGTKVFMVASAHVKHSPTYAYIFNWAFPRAAQTAGAFHACDIYFCHRNTNTWGLPSMFGTNDLQLSRAMVAYWKQFAVSSDPNVESLPRWESFGVGCSETPQWLRLGSSVLRSEDISRLKKLKLLAEHHRTRMDHYLAGGT